MSTFESLIFIPENILIKNHKLVKGSRNFLKSYTQELNLISIAKDDKKVFLPIMKELDIDQYFNALFFKENIANDQPFIKIINKLGLDPNTCLIIGNNLNDEIKEAEAENLKSLWIAPKREKVPITPHPTLKLSRLSDLEFYLN